MTLTEQSADLEQLSNIVRSWRQRGETVVFTNGCFDLLHCGHRWLLEHARRIGRRLIVAVNSDEYCRRVKGESRPAQPSAVRRRVVLNASHADLVLELTESNPESLLRVMTPDYYVLGSDYRGLDVPGLGYCGRVIFVERLPGVSTTEILLAQSELPKGLA